VQDLNLALDQMMEIDLNALVHDGDQNPMEVIINPLHPPPGDFLELNDILNGNDVVEQFIVQHDIPAMGLAKQALLVMADDELQQQVPHLPANLIDVLDEQVPLEHMIDFDEHGLPMNLDDALENLDEVHFD